MTDTVALANTFLQRTGGVVSPMRLQKLIYFTAVQYQQETGQPLVDDAFAAWDYGPVIPFLHYLTATPAAINVRGSRYSGALLLRHIDQVWTATKDVTPAQLAELCRLDGGAWWSAIRDGRRFLSDADMAEDRSFQKQLHLPLYGLTEGDTR